MALINNTAEIKIYLPVSTSMVFERPKPFIDVAENEYLKAVTGKDFLAELNDYYEGSIQDNEEWNQALEYAQRAIVYLAWYEGFDVLNVSMKDTGFVRAENENNKSLFNYQEKNLRTAFSKTGFNSLEQLIVYMEENIDEFPTWKASDEYSEQKDYFINTAGRFTEIYNALRASRLVYMNILSDMTLAEDFDISPVIGPTLFTKMKTIIKDGTIDDTGNAAYKALLPYIQKPTAYYTVGRCVINLGANFQEKGLFFSSFEVIDKNAQKEVQDPGKTMELIDTANDAARKYKDALLDYLDANKDDIPEYADWIGDDPDTFDPAYNNVNKKIQRM